MNIIQNIIKSLDNVSKKILSCDVKHIGYSPDIIMSRNELCTAGINFHGEKSGTIIMTIPSEKIDMVTDCILCKFGFEENLSPDVLYPEILNMYAGNVITEIEASDNRFTISISENFTEIDPYQTKADFMIHLKLYENFSLSFWFYITLQRKSYHD